MQQQQRLPFEWGESKPKSEPAQPRPKPPVATPVSSHTPPVTKSPARSASYHSSRTRRIRAIDAQTPSLFPELDAKKPVNKPDKTSTHRPSHAVQQRLPFDASEAPIADAPAAMENAAPEIAQPDTPPITDMPESDAPKLKLSAASIIGNEDLDDGSDPLASEVVKPLATPPPPRFKLAAPEAPAASSELEPAEEAPAAQEPATPEAPKLKLSAAPEAPAASSELEPAEEAPAAQEPATPEAPKLKLSAAPEAPAVSSELEPAEEVPAAQEPATPEAPKLKLSAVPETPVVTSEPEAAEEAPAAQEPATPEAPKLKLSAGPEAPAASSEQPTLKLSVGPEAKEPDSTPVAQSERPQPTNLAAPPRAQRPAVAVAKPKSASPRPVPKKRLPEETADDLPSDSATEPDEPEKPAPKPSSIDGFGQRLRVARESFGHTRQETAQACRIRPDFVRALEEEDFHKLPRAAIHIKSYVRTLAREYELDPVDLLESCEAAMAAADLSIHPEPSLRDSTKVRQAQLSSGDDESAPSGVKPAALVLAGIVVVIGLILIAYVVMTGGGAAPTTELPPVDSVGEADVEMLLAPEMLPFEEVPLPAAQPDPLSPPPQPAP